MKLQNKYVNIPEKVIEDWLFENPESVMTSDSCRVKRWIARQLKVPSGIIDLLGVDEDEQIVVVEVKNETPTSLALTQVKRYAADIENVLLNVNNYMIPVKSTVVGTGDISNQLLFEADALDVALMSYSVELTLKVGGVYSWMDEFRESLKEQYRQIAELELFDQFRQDEEQEENKIEQFIEESVDTESL